MLDTTVSVADCLSLPAAKHSLSLAYAMTFLNTFLVLPIFFGITLVNIGLREVSSDMADPFQV